VQYEPVEAGRLMTRKLRGDQEDRGLVCSARTITFLRGLGTVGIVAGALSGCATVKPPISQPQAAALPSRADATVAAVRPIGAFGSPGSNPDAAILPAMGISPAAAGMSGAMSEIIVRMDGGETLSVVQRSAVAFAPGERVVVLPEGTGPRLVPAPPPS
jgi:outer membrane lipoprotein SlyB